jgi:hypothetical protein
MPPNSVVSTDASSSVRCAFAAALAWPVAPLAAAALLLAACASLEPLDHPNGWRSSPSTALPNGCPDLSGTYATRANGAYPEHVGAYPLLNEILGPSALRDAQERDDPWPTSPDATTARFTASGDWLYVHFRDEAEGEVGLRFKRKNWWGGSTEGADAMYQCLELELGPTLGFDGPRRRIFAVPYLFAEGDVNFVFLSKGQDGSLIVNYRTNRVFITGSLIGSHARWVGSVWWRYPPALPDR